MKSFSPLLRYAALAGVLGLSACSDELRDPLSPAASAPAFNVSPTAAEEIYLIDSLCLNDDPGDASCVIDNGSTIYSIALNAGQANLTKVVDLVGACAAGLDCSRLFDQAHIGATPDGRKLYVVNRRHVDGANPAGYYDLDTNTFVHLGSIAGLPFEGTVLAAFSPTSALYIANAQSDRLYRLNSTTLAIEATYPLVKSTGGRLDVVGADIAFGANGTLYLWTNSGGEGLYTIAIPAADGANAVGTRLANSVFPFFSGLAIRGAGTGQLIGSSVPDDAIYEINPATGALGAQYDMFLNGSPFDHRFGDMTAGRLEIPVGQWCSPGYWRQPHHLDSWVATGYATTDKYNAFFDPDLSGNPTLLQVLQRPQTYGGAAFNKVGDLLSAAHPDVNFLGERIEDSCPLN